MIMRFNQFSLKRVLQIVFFFWTLGQVGVAAALNCNIHLVGNGAVRLSLASNQMILSGALSSTFGNTAWPDVSSVPVGAVLATQTFSWGAGSCMNLDERIFEKSANSRMQLLFRPSSLVDPGQFSGVDGWGGYTFRTNIDGVGIKLGFNETAPGPGGLFVGAVSGQPAGDGVYTGADFPAFSMSITLVKTAARFVNPNGRGVGANDNKSSVDVRMSNEEAGEFVFVNRDTGQTNPESIPVIFNITSSDSARIVTGSCGIAHVNNQSGGRNWAVVLPSASIGDFDEMGSTAYEQQIPWNIRCVGSADLKPQVTFTTAIVGQAAGVALPAQGSAVGVQLLMNGIPVVFGQAREVALNVSDYTGVDRGRYYFNGSWNDNFVWSYAGETLGGNSLAFRYYRDQPRNIPITPGEFSLGITISVDYL